MAPQTHRAQSVNQFLADGATARLHLEQLRGYAPDLNAAEDFWNYLKRVKLRAMCCRDLTHLKQDLRLAFARLRKCVGKCVGNVCGHCTPFEPDCTSLLNRARVARSRQVERPARLQRKTEQTVVYQVRRFPMKVAQHVFRALSDERTAPSERPSIQSLRLSRPMQ